VTLPPGFPHGVVRIITDPEAEAEQLASDRQTVSQEMCVQRGGHCYDLTREHPDLLPGPCKHCGVRPVRGPTV